MLSGRVLQTGRQLPYQPFIDILRRRLEQEQAPDELSALSGWPSCSASCQNFATAFLTCRCHPRMRRLDTSPV